METEVPEVFSTDPVESVLKVLRAHELPGVPVVNEGGRCVGIVTEADLVIGDEEGDIHIPHYIELFGGVVFLEPLRNFERKFKKAVASRVNDLMTEDPVTIDVAASAREAAKVIVDSHHNHLPVVEHGRLVGLVTRADVLGALVED